eukprot:TRINITY_DN271_c0_g1_i14.p1 TRINITY_DN271_c0_g1~~TRINITY_DN271_c0_g1_i14.p1  ORF type:complete len:313 (-),score=60.44 TRINITY_DN271_c0_g1_i14:690-1628(-)
MAEIPSEDGIIKQIIDGKEATVERTTTQSETDTEKIEIITVITTIEEPSKTIKTTQTLTITLNKQTNTKTTKRKKTTQEIKKQIVEDSDDLSPDGISEVYDPETGITSTRKQTTEEHETDENSIRTVTVVVTTPLGPDNEKIITTVTTHTTSKADGTKNTQRSVHELTRRKRRNTKLAKVLEESNFEKTNLIFGIDFTHSNTWNGRNTFNGKCLHHVGEEENPYQAVLRVIGEALECYTGDSQIPTFGFGDKRTHARSTFDFFPDHPEGKDLKSILERYAEIAKEVELSGPTSYAPIIRKAIEITVKEGGVC